MKMAETSRDYSRAELSKLGLGPGLEHSTGSRFGNREGCRGGSPRMY